MKEPTPKIVVANLALAGMVSQVGCVTVVLVVGALLLGLWLDRLLDTRPVMTIVLLLLSIPVSLYSLVRIALSTAEQFRVTSGQVSKTDDQPASALREESPHVADDQANSE
ncbi:MAG: AtpZ/AtpI family protein [Thermoflexales bacterium]|nr:AtpZ/AtpI family protein [Thermoflexales bacterium]